MPILWKRKAQVVALVSLMLVAQCCCCILPIRWRTSLGTTVQSAPAPSLVEISEACEQGLEPKAVVDFNQTSDEICVYEMDIESVDPSP